MIEKKFTINERSLSIEIADSFSDRLRGLMFRQTLEHDRGLLIIPCNSIHMMFMHFPIDAVYLDEHFRIKKIVEHLRPWLGLSLCFGAHSTLELAAGSARRLNLSVGQEFSVS